MTDTPQAPPAAIETPAPATPAEAATRLDALRADPKWTTALLSGGPAQTREFHKHHELVAKGDDVDIAMSGVLPGGIMQSSEQAEMTGTAAMLKNIGFT